LRSQSLPLGFQVAVNFRGFAAVQLVPEIHPASHIPDMFSACIRKKLIIGAPILCSQGLKIQAVDIIAGFSLAEGILSGQG